MSMTKEECLQVPLEKRITPILGRIHRIRDLANQVAYAEKHVLSSDKDDNQFKNLPEIPSDLNPECLRKNLKPIVFLIGGPATISKALATTIQRKFEFSVLYLGEILREEIKSGSPLGQFIAAKVSNKEFNIVVWLLKREVLKKFSCSHGLLIEGFPRSQEQLVSFENEVARAHLALICQVDFSLVGDKLTTLKGEEREKLATQIHQYRKYIAPLKEDFAKRGKIIYGGNEASRNLVDLHLSRMLLDWGFTEDDVKGKDSKICYTGIPLAAARGERNKSYGERMFETLGGTIPYFVQFNCKRGKLGFPELGLF